MSNKRRTRRARRRPALAATPAPVTNAPAESTAGALFIPFDEDRREQNFFVIARNLIPIFGILFLGWSASNLVILYFADTIASIWAIIAALSGHFDTRPPPANRLARIEMTLGLLFAALFIAAFIAVPLGVPLVISLSITNWSWQDALNDTAFIPGLLGIGLLALLSTLRHSLRLAWDPQGSEFLRDEFAIIFVRWMVLVLLIFHVAGLLGGLGPYLLVIAYVAATLAAQFYPQRFINLFGPFYRRKR